MKYIPRIPRLVATVFAVIGIHLFAGVALAEPQPPERLRCNYLENPLGMDDPAPRLSWVVADPTPGAVQSAYRIRAAASIEALTAEEGLLWDSGRVESDASFQIEWNGDPLPSATRIYWQVRTWDGASVASPWSEPTWFETGLMQAADWRGAEWISSNQEHLIYEPVPKEKMGDWISAGGIAADKVLFRKQFKVRGDVGLVAAHFWMGSADRTQTYLNVNEIDTIGLRYIYQAMPLTGGMPWLPKEQVQKPQERTAYAEIASYLHLGETNTLNIRADGQEGSAPVFCFGLTLEYADGTTQFVGTDNEWQVTQKIEGKENQTSTIPNDDRWSDAKVVDPYGGPVYGTIINCLPVPYVPPLLRKSFELRGEPVRARAYLTGVGYHQFRLNGQLVGDRVLDPGQTNYQEQTFYVVHDITSYLQQGTNAVGIALGDGFFNQNIAWRPAVVWYGKPRAIALLVVEYADGTQDFVKTDGSWSFSTGALRSSNIYGGEYYDARLAKEGWSLPGYDASDWQAVEVTGPGEIGKLIAQPIPPMRRMQEIAPVAVDEPVPGTYVFDMGINFTGWVRLRVREAPGTLVNLRFAEQLLPDGRADLHGSGVGANGYAQTDQFIAGSEAVDEWEPDFVYHAFRYVEVSGLSARPAADTITGVEVYTDVARTGFFESSIPLLNQIKEVATHTFLCNLHSVIEDCPHRERCQWGHNSLMAEAMMFDFDIAPMFVKFVSDFYENPIEGYGYPSNIGTGKRLSGNGDIPSAGAPIEVAGFLNMFYGEDAVAFENYPGMQAWIHFNQRRAAGAGGFANEPGRYGDHAFPGWVTQPPPRELISTLVWTHQLDVLADISRRMGKVAEAQSYDGIAEALRSRIISKYYKREEGTFGSQSADALAIRFGIVPGEETRLGRSIAKDIDARKGHMVGGMVGYPKIPDALSSTGFADWAVQGMTAQIDSSIPYEVAQGATTIWEVYHAPGSSGERSISKNHPNYGGLVKWFYQGVAGIHPLPESPGFHRFRLRPEVTWSMDWARAKYDSISGTILSDWKREPNWLDWSFAIPANTSAEVWVPVQDENTKAWAGRGMLAESLPTVTFLRSEPGYRVYEIGSGDYNFRVPMDSSRALPRPSLEQTPPPALPAPTPAKPAAAPPKPVAATRAATATTPNSLPIQGDLPGVTILPVNATTSSEFAEGWRLNTILPVNYGRGQQQTRVDATALHPNSNWVSKQNEIAGTWIGFDLGGRYDLTHLKIHNANLPRDLDRGVRQFDIFVSSDTKNWTEVASDQVLARSKGAGVEWQLIPFTAKAVRHVRLRIDSNYGSSFVGLAKVLFQGMPGEGQSVLPLQSVSVDTGKMGSLQLETWPPEKMIDRSGIQSGDAMNATADALPANNWISAKGQTTGDIVWSFTQASDLQSMLVWNGNDGRNAPRNAKDFNLYVSSGAGGDSWTPVVSNGRLIGAPNNGTWTGPQAIGVDRKGVRRVKMEILSNYGAADLTMLQEVAFIGRNNQDL